jgi:rubrerythrin
MSELLPLNAPKTVKEASALIYSTGEPDIEVLRLMVLLEASGLGAYEDLALSTQNPDVAGLLRQNGREELAHAHRVKKAIYILVGIDYEIPPLEMNPYYERRTEVALTADMLRTIAQSERRGEALYQTWAASTESAEVADLFMLNGVEERGHSARLEKAAELLAD